MCENERDMPLLDKILNRRDQQQFSPAYTEVMTSRVSEDLDNNLIDEKAKRLK